MRKFVCAALLAACVPAMAAEEWVEVASTPDTAWAIKPGSFSQGVTDGKRPMAYVIGRFSDKSRNRVDINRWYVLLSDCNREMGELVTLDLKGAFLFSNDFAFGAGNIASKIAETICQVSAMSSSKS